MKYIITATAITTTTTITKTNNDNNNSKVIKRGKVVPAAKLIS
jgi:hypothetical protein